MAKAAIKVGTVKIDPTKRKMGDLELQVYLREKKRGCGAHGAGDKPRQNTVRNYE